MPRRYWLAMNECSHQSAVVNSFRFLAVPTEGRHLLSGVAARRDGRGGVMDDRCPHCDSDLTGEEIPEAHKKYYGDKTHFSRKIGLYDRWLDMTTQWQCPDCRHTWDRFNKTGPGSPRDLPGE
jgi:hypothetical protein